jgi:threonylcarbamoyladenosine tRNA methylthiotransferase MtaB
VFGADLIAGFPTETAAMADNSLKLIDDCGLTFLHVFPFSPRPGTPAERMPQLPRDVVRERARALREAGARALGRFLDGEVGATREVLVEGDGHGRTPHYAGVRFAGPAAPGCLRQARIVGRGEDHLRACSSHEHVQAPVQPHAWRRGGRGAPAGTRGGSRAAVARSAGRAPTGAKD